VSPLAGKPLPADAPRLQPSPIQDYEVFRARQEQRISSYGWVDREREVVHIPIERAMELLIERGQPQAKSDSQRGRDQQNGERND
jgi:hypothetical protein